MLQKTETTKRYRAIFISDIHLGTRRAQAEAFLDFLAHTESEYLYLVGDIIDSWSLRQHWHWQQSHNDVIQKLLRKARKGAKLIYIESGDLTIAHMEALLTALKEAVKGGVTNFIVPVGSFAQLSVLYYAQAGVWLPIPDVYAKFDQPTYEGEVPILDVPIEFESLGSARVAFVSSETPFGEDLGGDALRNLTAAVKRLLTADEGTLILAASP